MAHPSKQLPKKTLELIQERDQIYCPFEFIEVAKAHRYNLSLKDALEIILEREVSREEVEMVRKQGERDEEMRGRRDAFGFD